MLGGVQAVAWADVKQMVIIVGGLLAVVAALVLGLPGGVGLGDAMHLAGAAERLTTIDFSLDPGETYTFWSGLLGGLFLALGYFGCDQSQVQRHLTADSVDAARRSLLMSAYWKIPLQALILLTGVLVFVFHLFNPAPMLFHPVRDAAVRAGDRAAEYAGLEAEFEEAFADRRTAADEMLAARRAGGAAAVAEARAAFAASQERVGAVRGRAAGLVEEATGEEYTDVNYVFPTFIVNHLPVGLVGLLIAAIFAAAMSSAAAELAALSTTSVIDFYRRYLNTGATDRHYLRVSKLATALWGVVATVFAVFAANLGSLIEVVNQVGSVLLRVPPRGVRARRGVPPRHRRRGLRGPLRGHGVGGPGRERGRRLLPVEQRHRHRRGRRRGPRGEPAPAREPPRFHRAGSRRGRALSGSRAATSRSRPATPPGGGAGRPAGVVARSRPVIC